MTTKEMDIDSEVEGTHHPLVLLDDDKNLPALSNPALHRYLQEISQYELLSREETEELAVRKLPFTEALDMVFDGRITDALSQLALMRVGFLINPRGFPNLAGL